MIRDPARCIGAPIAVLLIAVLSPTAPALAQDWEEQPYSVHARMRLQAGMFAPGLSSLYAPHENVAFETNSSGVGMGQPCDPVVTPRAPCTPQDHGKRPGSPSIARAMVDLEAHWDLNRMLALHAIVRAVRSAPLEADERARVPLLLPAEPGQSPAELGAARRSYAKGFAHDYYNEVELREFYLDFWPADWLTVRLGRQQVAWGETGQFRMLDVVNPVNASWHLSPLEDFEDQRIPLWMMLTTVDIPALKGSLDLVYIPGVDRAEDLVNTPLSMVGAWGLPYSNKPPRFEVAFKDFQYPGGGLDPAHMRGGVRWKGLLGDHGSYSLVYMYTHMMIPVLESVTYALDEMGTPNSYVAENAALIYPRRHVAGASLEWALPRPLSGVFRFEGAVEPNRTYSPNTISDGDTRDPRGIQYHPRTKPTLNYALVYQRPTMVRWLNPTQNILLVAQFMHSHVFDVDPVRDAGLVHVIGFNDWALQENIYTAVFDARTSYLHRRLEPRITGVLRRNPEYGQSGFISVQLRIRLAQSWYLDVRRTDFFGQNPYRDIGLFRDRDEVHAALTFYL